MSSHSFKQSLRYLSRPWLALKLCFIQCIINPERPLWKRLDHTVNRLLEVNQKRRAHAKSQAVQ